MERSIREVDRVKGIREKPDANGEKSESEDNSEVDVRLKIIVPVLVYEYVVVYNRDDKCQCETVED